MDLFNRYIDQTITSAPAEQRSPIARFYAGKSILVTGATGFIGKVLIEKLLYSCAKVDKIYLLIRGARAKTPQDRLNEMINQVPFTVRLKAQVCIDKLVAIDCDLAKDNLGLSEADTKLLIRDVAVVFHVAASVKFEAPFEMNMRHNVIATRQLVELACRFKKLLCFVHVSTAYSNCHLKHIEEKIYRIDVPDDLTTLKETPELLDKRPNTYTLTKALAENIVAKYSNRVNVVIVRPSIVMSAMREPTEGWVDTINGPVGLSVLGALGILQKIKVNSNVVFDLIPVDTVSNAIVAVAWASSERANEFTTTYNNKVRVFNLTTGNENPCTFYDYFREGRDEAYKTPSTFAMRPLLKIPKQTGTNTFNYWIHKVFSHLLFAHIVDTILGWCGKKKIVVKAVNKMHHANEIFDYFCANQWNFVTANVRTLRSIQTKHDRQEFDCNVRSLNWSEYSKVSWMGCRRFILKEPDDNVEYARRRYRTLCALYYVTKLVLVLCVTCCVLAFGGAGPGHRAVQGAVLLPIYSMIYLL